MPRKAVSTKNVNGVLYYTSTYFAEEVGLESRQARKYLEDFQSLEGHKNPRLYDKKTIDKAVNAYMSGKEGELLAEQRRQRMREMEQERARKEEQTYIEQIEELIQNQAKGQENDENIQRDEYVRAKVENIYKSELVIMLLKHILFNQGFEFDEKLFKQDLLTFHDVEAIRRSGDEYTDDELEVVSRLKSNNAYLIDK